MNQIWFSDAVWRTSEAPGFRPGYIACACFGVILILTCFLMRFLEKRDKTQRMEGPVAVVQGGSHSNNAKISDRTDNIVA